MPCPTTVPLRRFVERRHPAGDEPAGDRGATGNDRSSPSARRVEPTGPIRADERVAPDLAPWSGSRRSKRSAHACCQIGRTGAERLTETVCLHGHASTDAPVDFGGSAHRQLGEIMGEGTETMNRGLRRGWVRTCIDDWFDVVAEEMTGFGELRSIRQPRFVRPVGGGGRGGGGRGGRRRGDGHNASAATPTTAAITRPMISAMVAAERDRCTSLDSPSRSAQAPHPRRARPRARRRVLHPPWARSSPGKSVWIGTCVDPLVRRRSRSRCDQTIKRRFRDSGVRRHPRLGHRLGDQGDVGSLVGRSARRQRLARRSRGHGAGIDRGPGAEVADAPRRSEAERAVGRRRRRGWPGWSVWACTWSPQRSPSKSSGSVWDRSSSSS